MPVQATAKAVVFDVGGVLVEWNPRNLYRKIFADTAPMEWFLATRTLARSPAAGGTSHRRPPRRLRLCGHEAATASAAQHAGLQSAEGAIGARFAQARGLYGPRRTVPPFSIRAIMAQKSLPIFLARPVWRELVALGTGGEPGPHHLRFDVGHG